MYSAVNTLDNQPTSPPEWLPVIPLAQVERDMIERALKQYRSLPAAAAALGLSKGALKQRIWRKHISRVDLHPRESHNVTATVPK